ncbi:hypothetical protein [Rhodococcus sp. NPDC058514]|uniref:hypothetical protein n=1 Tax=unclassified Rhodococcus (in: high G+C Gram-positive bacteria) TaxID=192944 RepID=UPI003664D18B
MTSGTSTAPPGRGILDSAILGLLVFDGVLTAVLAVLFLPAHLGSVAFPISALVAAVINVLLVLGARTVTDRTSRAALPLLGWFLGFVLCMFGGPGGDSLLLASPLTLLLLGLAVVPAGLLLLKFASDEAVARGGSARPI